MIIQENSNETLFIGDIQENKVSIDVKNIDWIMQILSTNFYSKPIYSLIRECCTNALDSHIEAGVTKPIILDLGELNGQLYCRIQDFGVGLSPERFKEVYLNLGSSTKRNTNELHGGFGIGRFSVLAYNGQAYITSCYNGTKYKYLMHNNGITINIDLIEETLCDCENGVEVMVYIKEKKDVEEFVDAIKEQLLYFEGLRVITNIENYHYYYRGRTPISDIDNFNRYKIKKFKTFSTIMVPKDVENFNLGINLLIGNITYPLNTQYFMDFEDLHRQPISVHIPIGVLDIVPNRENIIYNEKNISIIKKAILEVKKELSTLKNEYFKKDISALDYYEIVSSLDVPLVNVEGYRKVYYKYNESEISSIKYKGVYYAYYDIRKSVETIKDSSISTSVLKGIKVFKSNCRLYQLRNFSVFTKKVPNTHISQYLQQTKKECVVSLESVINKYKQLYRISDNTFVKAYLREFFLQHRDKIVKDFIPIGHSSVKQRKKKKSIEEGNITLYQPYTSSQQNTQWKSQEFKLEDLHGNRYFFLKNKLVVYGNKDDKLFTQMATAKLYNLKNLKNIEFLGIAPSKEKHIETITNYLSFKEFMEVSNQYKTILDIGTYMYLKDTYNNKGISKLSNLYSDSIIKISSFYGGIVDRYRQFMYLQKIESVGKTKELYEEIYSICKENNIWNFEIKDMVDMHSDTLEKLWTVVEPFIISTYSGNTIKENSYLLIADYLLARGVIRPNENLVRELNSNPYYINIKNRKK